MGNFFDTAFTHPILNLLIALYKGFLFVKIPGAFGFAIISLTVIIRLIIHPFFKQQMELSKKMQDIKPHMDNLAKKHKNDQKTLQQAQLKLYQEHNINPAAGCLFAIIQIPVFYALFNVLNNFWLHGNDAKIIAQINSFIYHPSLKIITIDPFFFGLNLATTPAKTGNYLFILIPITTALLQYIQFKFSTPALPPKKEGEKSDTSEDFQRAMSIQMRYIFPLMIGWFSYSLPIGLSLYYNVFSIFSIIQYRNINSKKSSIPIPITQKEDDQIEDAEIVENEKEKKQIPVSIPKKNKGKKGKKK
ncbi:MAG: YidC/Oxa1 family membrane protein insertase [Candidatus Roizmanbacteria bacterium]